MNPGADLFTGTVWNFASRHCDGQPDHLFIDQAGQKALLSPA